MSVVALNIPKKYLDIPILGEPKPNIGFNDEEWKSFYEYLTQFELLVGNLIKCRPRSNEERLEIYFDISDDLRGRIGTLWSDELRQIKEKKDE